LAAGFLGPAAVREAIPAGNCFTARRGQQPSEGEVLSAGAPQSPARKSNTGVECVQACWPV